MLTFRNEFFQGETMNVNIYEVYNNQNLHYLFCHGHIDVLLFREECIKNFYTEPVRIVQEWRKETIINIETKKGKLRKKISTQRCNCSEIDAFPVTIGYV